jgi:STE24 endopeptidase
VANEDKATRYHRSRRRAAAASASVGAGFLCLAVVSGLSTAIRDVVVNVVGLSGVVAAIGYGLVLALLYEALRTPGAYYLGVQLDRRYGLSSQTAAQWWRGHLAGSAAVVALAAGGAGVASGLLHSAPGAWWAIAAMVLTVALVAAAHLVPAFVPPAVRDVGPLVRPALARRLQDLATRCRTPVADVSVWHVSPRTRKANATVVGLGRTRRILLSDTLLAEHGDDEVEAIVAHELAHVAYGDTWMSLGLQAAVIGSGCYAADWLLRASVGPLGLAGMADLAGLPLVALAGWLVSRAWLPASNVLSQFQERRADRSVNLAESRPARLADALFYSHPSVASRIDAVQHLTRERLGEQPSRVR